MGMLSVFGTVATLAAGSFLFLSPSPSAGDASQNAPSRVHSFGGRSGKILAFLETRKGLEELERSGLEVKVDVPGVYPFRWPLSWPPNHPRNGASLILLTPFSEKQDGRIGRYVLGTWPNEKGQEKETSAAAAYAAARRAYALPAGFIKVTRKAAATRVSKHFRLGDFLTKDQQSVWPKYLVLDLDLVDKLELVIEALHHAGHPVKGLHVMSGFRTPAYNALDVGPGSRSAISRHLYGDAADVYPDDDHDGRPDDLSGNGVMDLADAEILAKAAESVEKAHPDLLGGISIYPATAAHGPFVHIDTRGRRARW